MPYKKTIADPNTFLANVADLYQGTMRIFMEYIDNSLDSAESMYRKEGEYAYPIKIEIKIDPDNKKVYFLDNCEGMNKGYEESSGIWKDGLLAIITGIGKSTKRGVSWLNGKFGFGFHAYMACAEKISVITTKKDMDHCLFVELSSQTMDVDDEKKISKSKFPYESGTLVTISNFKKDWWNEIDHLLLKKEIEKHFEQLLGRENLEIKVIYGDEEEVCRPFDYDGYLGKKIEKEIFELRLRKKGTEEVVKLKSPVRIYLKITEDVLISKRPVFINKGRRIEEVQVIKSFKLKSKYKGSCWSHSNLTGYIDVAGLISPTLSRDDFIRSEERDAIYQEMIQLEDEIVAELVEVNSRIQDVGMTRLENALSGALNKLIKDYNFRFKPELVPGEDINVQEYEEGNFIFSQNTGDGKRGDGDAVDNPKKEDIVVAKTDDETDLKAREKKGNGFLIKFSDREAKRSDGTLFCSQYVEGEGITIYTTHPEFKKRIRNNKIINQRLISYLASQIMIRFKDKFYDKKGKQPEVQSILNSRSDLFDDMMFGVYEFEEMLQPLNGKSLINLEDSSDQNYE